MYKKMKNKQKKPLSIQWKIFFFLFGFCAILLTFLWLFQVVFLESFYKSIKTAEVRRDAEIFVTSLENSDLTSVVDTIKERNDLYVEVWTTDGQSLLISASAIPGIQEKMTYDEKVDLYNRTVGAGGELMEKYFIEMSTAETVAFRSESEEVILYSILLKNDGKEGLLIVSSRISPVNATVMTLRTQLIYVTVAMLVLALLSAFIMARIVSRPIYKINESAKKLGKGNYNVEFVGGGYREISELADTLTQTEQELSKVNNLQKELVANISHDLRTPLTLITGYIEMMRDFPEEDTTENVQLVLDECQRMTTLVRDTLDISKIQSGTVELYRESFSLTEAIRECIDRFQGLVEKTGHKLSFTYDEEIYVCADPLRISQVLYNLINNAITHTGQDQEVFVSQKELDGKVYVEIRDTGDGITPEALPYIWDRYYKVDKVHKQSFTGTGLGLSIVKSILDMHKNAEYGVESVTGEGATFWFSLPIYKEALPKEETNKTE